MWRGDGKEEGMEGKDAPKTFRIPVGPLPEPSKSLHKIEASTNILNQKQG